MKLYSGSLTRFFLGHWQGAAPLENDDDSTDDGATPEEVRAYFEKFIGLLAQSLGDQVKLAWSEALDGPHEVVTVGEAEFGSLLIVAARASVADKRLSPVSKERAWNEDPAVISLQDEQEDFLSCHHLVKADSWLPANFSMIVETAAAERDLIFGSLPQLAMALDRVAEVLGAPNETTRKLSPQLLNEARLAHASLTQIVTWAIANGMPMLIEP